MPRKPIICLDFDGVIHSYTSGWTKPDVILDPPVPGAFDAIMDYQLVAVVAVYSSRSNHAGAIPAMIEWFKTWDFPEDNLLSIWFPTIKPPAIVTIDDRGYRFDGTWPDPQTLLDLKPWNKE